MSREDRIASKFAGMCDFIQYVAKEHPLILTQWKNKIAGVDETPAAGTTQSTEGLIRYDYTRDK